MEHIQNLFKVQGGFRGYKDSQPSPAINSPHTFRKTPPTASIETQSEESLIQKIAAQFVLQTPQSAIRFAKDIDNVDGREIPKSRGGNPIKKQELFPKVQYTFGKERFPESLKEQCSKKTQDKTKEAVSLIFLVWLISQREVVSELSTLRKSLQQERKCLMKTQESLESSVQQLSAEITDLHTVIQECRQAPPSSGRLMWRSSCVSGMVSVMLLLLLVACTRKNNLKQRLASCSAYIQKLATICTGRATNGLHMLYKHISDRWVTYLWRYTGPRERCR